MTVCWYLVKANWPQTSAKEPNFAGVGGDVWPLEGIQDSGARRLHHELMRSRSHLQVGRTTELLCVDRALANDYYKEAERLGKGAWLLELTPGEGVAASGDGFDVGIPSGGGSIVESELITQGRPGPRLNRWGLFASKSDAVSYMAARTGCEDLEEAEGLELLSVRVLRHS